MCIFVVVAIVTDTPLIKLFNGEQEKSSQKASTSPEAEGRLKDSDEGLVRHTSRCGVTLDPAAFNFSLAQLFPSQEPFEFESFTCAQNKKPHIKGLHVLLHPDAENT